MYVYMHEYLEHEGVHIQTDIHMAALLDRTLPDAVFAAALLSAVPPTVCALSSNANHWLSWRQQHAPALRPCWATTRFSDTSQIHQWLSIFDNARSSGLDAWWRPAAGVTLAPERHWRRVATTALTT